ncbi:hypothetical protein PF0506 [Pyrococcus furiosus DSM 3638]|uniref:Uncharacterized protein n=1 Tax=Pyrococcus furiosus (strain ATCC 43587 / DSM 3638 / JCM 8422 / Vc1) TaxID=186497 RepID=Q8U3G2_PYRFU|nr:hypothetical protein PF0506 [Pyrococcus furiosus DSM 3638]
MNNLYDKFEDKRIYRVFGLNNIEEYLGGGKDEEGTRSN